MYFKVSQELELKNVCKEFFERRNMELHTIQFLYDDTHIRGKQTPKLVSFNAIPKTKILLQFFNHFFTSAVGDLTSLEIMIFHYL